MMDDARGAADDRLFAGAGTGFTNRQFDGVNMGTPDEGPQMGING